MSKRLIEKWMPIAALGVESTRERTPMTPFPAPNRLHVWWARRPLVMARAAVLASLLPEDADQDKFMHAIGIHGDPVTSRRRIDQAKRTGDRFDGQAYSYPRAFLYSPDVEDRKWMTHQLREFGVDGPRVLDPTAGGGSIPFESARLGLNTIANELNPVAAMILKATISFPFEIGPEVLSKYEEIASKFLELRDHQIRDNYPLEPNPNSVATNYLWARTVVCPYCKGLIPLSPNWRLAPGGIGVRLRPDPATKKCSFQIVSSVSRQSEGTVSGGSAKCPFSDCGRVVDGDEVRRQARAGDMGHQLYAVVYKEFVESKTKSGRIRGKWERNYRSPVPGDDNRADIAAKMEEKLPEWTAFDIVPSEEFPRDSNDDRPIQYGMPLWKDLFSPRQLLYHGTSVEVFRKVHEEEIQRGGLGEVTKAALVFLSFALDKMLNYNAILSSWIVNSVRTRSVFDRHDYSVKWSYAEMAPSISGFQNDWAIAETAKCIKELIELSGVHSSSVAMNGKSGQQSFSLDPAASAPEIRVVNGSADNMYELDEASIDVVVMDPPYYNNVMYAELSDFFYVWLKRTAGRIYPELFTRRLTDKDNEAVASPAKFSGQKGAKALAYGDYQQRMAAIFSECHRVLKPDGIMTIMFTHKATGAWDALTKGLIEGGFTITASWPVNTESGGSLHIRDKSAANSTILLVCRPRIDRTADKVEYWEDVAPIVSSAVRKRVEEFQKAGITGVDLYLSCFGPALQVFAEHWPLTRGQPKPKQKTGRRQSTMLEEEDPYSVTPEDALEAARATVKEWRLQQIMRTSRRSELEKLTEWFVLAWDSFKAPQFPYDEGLRLARVVGLDMDREVIGLLAEKKGSNLLIWDSATRVAKGALGPADGSRGMIDAIHHAAYQVRNQGLNAAREMLEQNGVDKAPGFLAALTAVLEVLPVSSAFTKVTGETGPVAEAASDFDALEHLRRLAFSESVPEPKQLELWQE